MRRRGGGVTHFFVGAQPLCSSVEEKENVTCLRTFGLSAGLSSSSRQRRAAAAAAAGVRRCLRCSHSLSERTAPSVRRTGTRASAHKKNHETCVSSVVLVGGGERRGQSPHLRCPFGISCLMPLSHRFTGFIVASMCAKNSRAKSTQHAQGGGGRGEILKVGGSPCQVGGGERGDVCCGDGGMRENFLLFSPLLLRSTALLSVAPKSFQLV